MLQKFLISVTWYVAQALVARGTRREPEELLDLERSHGCQRDEVTVLLSILTAGHGRWDPTGYSKPAPADSI